MSSFDWQNIAVFFIVIAALAYAARRGWSRLRSFTRAGQNDSTCATGCGKCGAAAPSINESTRGTVLVQIGGRKRV